MKPKEFDELLKSKFDENEFAYNPANWQRLVEQMDRKPGRKSKVLIWLPLAALASTASIAASIAMIITTVPGIWHHKNPAVYAQAHKVHIQEHRIMQPAAPMQPADANAPAVAAALPEHAQKTTINEPKKQSIPETTNTVAAANNIAINSGTVTEKPQVIAGNTADKPVNTFNEHAFADVYSDNLFEPPTQKENYDKTMVSIAGGVNYGAVSSGYTIGATGKHMLNERLYVEGDVAFVNSSTPTTTNIAATNTDNTVNLPTAKLSTTTSTEAVVNPPKEIRSSPGTPKATNYNIYYAQVAPSVGYNVLKHFSVGVGADVQRLIQDNRPDNTDYTAMKEAPTYDLGVIGKTEYTLSSKIKAGIYYRQGMNNVITGSDKYIDRSYVQLQIKYTILKK